MGIDRTGAQRYAEAYAVSNDGRFVEWMSLQGYDEQIYVRDMQQPRSDWMNPPAHLTYGDGQPQRSCRLDPRRPRLPTQLKATQASSARPSVTHARSSGDAANGAPSASARVSTSSAEAPARSPA